MSDAGNRRFERAVQEGDPKARLVLFRSHTHAGCNMLDPAGTCDICASVIADAHEWFRAWSQNLVDPLVRAALARTAINMPLLPSEQEIINDVMERSRSAEYYGETLRCLLMRVDAASAAAPPRPPQTSNTDPNARCFCGCTRAEHCGSFQGTVPGPECSRCGCLSFDLFLPSVNCPCGHEHQGMTCGVCACTNGPRQLCATCGRFYSEHSYPLPTPHRFIPITVETPARVTPAIRCTNCGHAAHYSRRCGLATGMNPTTFCPCETQTSDAPVRRDHCEQQAALRLRCSHCRHDHRSGQRCGHRISGSYMSDYSGDPEYCECLAIIEQLTCGHCRHPDHTGGRCGVRVALEGQQGPCGCFVYNHGAAAALDLP
jgi:hypothetical protein